MNKKILAISISTMVVLYSILTSVIILIFLLTKMPVEIGIVICIIMILAEFIMAPEINDFVFKHFYKMQFTEDIPEYLKLFIEESCRKHNMKYPRIGLINDGSPNAFTYGRTKNDARVVITRGILNILTEDEVKAVVAHELGHANHYDMLFMTVAQIVPLILYYIYNALLRTKSKSSSKNNNDYGAMIGLIAYVLYIISQYIILWLSRTREYYADSFAIEETGNPKALGDALVKIGFGLALGNKDENSKVSQGNALGISNAKDSKGIAICALNNGGVSKQNIVNAMKWERWNMWAKINELNSTHPLISKRLLAIAARSEEYGQEPYIIFDEEKTESYLDDFIIEILIAVLPVIVSIISFILIVISIINKFMNPLLLTGICGILFAMSLLVLLNRTHKNKDYEETNVAELLGKVKVSKITSIPCIIEGKIIGRGNPGCVFNEDFVLQDETGIMFLDYNQPLYAIEKLFAIFRSKDYFDKEVRIKGWYRRGIVPYVEIYSMDIDGKTKKCHTYATSKALCWIFIIISIICIIMSLV